MQNHMIWPILSHLIRAVHQKGYPVYTQWDNYLEKSAKLSRYYSHSHSLIFYKDFALYFTKIWPIVQRKALV